MGGRKIGRQCTSSHTKTSTGFAFVICLQGERWRRGSPQWLLGRSQLGIWGDLDSLRLSRARRTFASPVPSRQNNGHTRTSRQNSSQPATFPARSGSAVPRPALPRAMPGRRPSPPRPAARARPRGESLPDDGDRAGGLGNGRAPPLGPDAFRLELACSASPLPAAAPPPPRRRACPARRSTPESPRARRACILPS